MPADNFARTWSGFVTPLSARDRSRAKLECGRQLHLPLPLGEVPRRGRRGPSQARPRPCQLPQRGSQGARQIVVWRGDDMYTPTVGEGISLPRGTGFQNGILPGEFVQPQGFSVGAPILGARAVQGQRTINVGRIRCHFHLFSLNPNLLESQPGGRPGWAPLRTEETCFHSTKQAKCFRWRASVASPTLGGHKLPAKFQFTSVLIKTDSIKPNYSNFSGGNT